MNTLNGRHWIGIRREPGGEEDRRKTGKYPFLRKRKNAAKRGAKLRDGRAAEFSCR